MFQCNLCARQFTTRFNLKRHGEEQHNGKKYNCTTCNFSFARKYRLNQHLKLRHSNAHDKTSKFTPVDVTLNNDQPENVFPDAIQEATALGDAILSATHTIENFHGCRFIYEINCTEFK